MPLKDLGSSMWTSSSWTLTKPNKWQCKYKDVNTTLGDMSLGHMFIVCMRMLTKKHFNRIDMNKLMSSTPMQVRSVCLCFNLWFFGPSIITWMHISKMLQWLHRQWAGNRLQVSIQLIHQWCASCHPNKKGRNGDLSFFKTQCQEITFHLAVLFEFIWKVPCW